MKNRGTLIVAGLILSYSVFETYNILVPLELSTEGVCRYFLGAFVAAVAWYFSGSRNTAGQNVIGNICPVFFFPLGLVFSASLLFWRALCPPPNEGKGEVGEEDMAFFEIRSQLLSKPFQKEQRELFLPAISLLDSGDMDERRAAIDVLAQIGGPEQIRHLQSCLDDPEREVYQFAHAKLTGLHERHTEGIKAAQQAGSRESLLDRYIDYIGSGLLGEATSAFYRQKAVGVALALLKETPDNVFLLNLLAKLYLDQGSETEAQLLLEKSLQLDDESLETSWILAQLAYESRDYHSLQKHLITLKKLSMIKDTKRNEILQAVSWWLDGDGNRSL